MRYCKKCVMPDTRPGIKFGEDGVCYPCRNYEKRKLVNWDDRWKQLEKLADKYRGRNGDNYDCIVAASAGKDSWFQTHIFKEKLGMNPLIVNVDNFSWTETGKHNWSNLLSAFGVDALKISLNPQLCKRIFVKALEMLGSPTWYFDRAIYAFPYQMGIKLGIPLIVYGENTNYEYGGPLAEETYSALLQMKNDVVKPVAWEKWLGDGITMKDLNPGIEPTLAEMEKAHLEPIFLSYFIPWDGYNNFQFARTRGFRSLDDTNEWNRVGFLENYEQIDTIGYLTHTWFKFPKFGHQRVTEVASKYIRAGRMKRAEAVKLVNEEDYKLDRKMLRDFLSFCEYEESDFWKVVDKFANRDIVEKRDGAWRLKEPCK